MPEVAAAPAPAAPSSTPSVVPSKAPAAPVKPNPVGSGSAPAGGAAPVAAKPDPTTPPPPARLTRKEKIDGKEQEISATEEELWAAYRKNSTVDRRFEEAAKERKEIAAEKQRVEEMYARLQSPEALLEVFMQANPEADPIEAMASLLRQRMEEEEQLNDPNIRERRRLERENAEYKSKEQKALEEQQAQVREQEFQTALQDLGQKFTEALALTKLPKNDITMELMAKAEKVNRTQGWNLSPQQLAAATEKSVAGMIEGMTGEGVTDEQVLEMFPAFTKRVHKAIVARFKARGAAGQQQQDITPRAPRPPEGQAPAKPRVMGSKEEQEAYGIKGLRTI